MSSSCHRLMRARQDLIEIFSSFVQFEADRFGGWLSDPRLRRSMQRCREQSAVGSDQERLWVVYWHRQWQAQPQSIAQAHLLAYLQEACYWVAYKASTRFTSAQYGVADCFQMAIAQLSKVLKGFDAHQGFDLKNYASTTFRSFIRDYLRQRRETDICTDWSLLRKVSQKRLTDALQAQGLTPDEVEPYLLAWQAYRLICVPPQGTGTRRLSAPDEQAWAAIAQQYNAERHSLPGAAKTASAKQVEAWMVGAAKAVRSYLYPGAVSMNATRPGQEAGEFIDSLTDADERSPIDALIAAEAQAQRQQQQAQLSEVLAAAVAKLPADAQKLLELYYGADLTQKEIAAQLGIKQYSISRQLSRIRKALLLSLGEWAQARLHISLSPDLLKYTSAALEEWLATRYGS